MRSGTRVISWHHFRIFAAAIAAVMAAAGGACSGGGGGGSPTEPGSSPPANLAGSWTGTGGVESGTGYCSEVVQGFQPHDIDLRITQTGASIDVRWTNRPPFGSLTCQFTGRVSGTSFTLEPDFARSHANCGPEQDFLCGRQFVRRVQDLDASRVEGSVSGGQMDIRSSSVFDYYDRRTGQRLGRGTFQGRVSLTRE
jgi:hypothetical protein